MNQTHPGVYDQLMSFAQLLENHYRDVQDVEFTIEQGRLFILQTRNAARTPAASVKSAVDMTEEGLITQTEAIQRVDPDELNRLLVPRFDQQARAAAVDSGSLIARGTPASPGAAAGTVLLQRQRGRRSRSRRRKRHPRSPRNQPRRHPTASSNPRASSPAAAAPPATPPSSPAASARPCIVGTEEMSFSRDGSSFQSRGRTVRQGDQISIDGATGEVFLGEIATVSPDLDELTEARQLLSWADDRRKLGIMANADTESDAARALSLGAEGIGLCRTEHMFLGPERVAVVQQVLLNAAEVERWKPKTPRRGRSIYGRRPLPKTCPPPSIPTTAPQPIRTIAGGRLPQDSRRHGRPPRNHPPPGRSPP